MKIVKTQNTATREIVKQAAAVLADGGLVLYPTETVYGAGVDATNQAAVKKLLAYKSRREGKPLSIAVTDDAMAADYVELNEQAQALYHQFMPGPVTIISDSKGKVAEGVASEFDTLGTRIPDYPLVLQLIKQFGKPITATSANVSGKKRPYSVDDILDNLSNKQKSLVDLIIDAGELPKNDPSTVIDTTLSTPVTVRGGQLAGESLVPDAEADLLLDSNSEAETKEIAGRLLLQHLDSVGKTGLAIGLEGPLGAGKTVFTKGAAEFLGVKETITSPTYTYIEEYDFKRHQTTGKLYHLDMWKVETKEVFERLQVAELLQPQNVVVIEWYGQVKSWIEGEIISQNMPLITIQIEEGAQQNQRTLKIKQPNNNE